MFGEYETGSGDVPGVNTSSQPPGYPTPVSTPSLPHPQPYPQQPPPAYHQYAYPPQYLHPGATPQYRAHPAPFPSTSTAPSQFSNANGPAMSTQIAAVQNSSIPLYSSPYPPPGDGFNVPGYPAGQQATYPQTATTWPHPAPFQAPGMPAVFPYPTGPVPAPPYYEDHTRHSTSPRRDLSPNHHSNRSPRRSLSPTSSRRNSRSPRRRRDERSSSDCWKRSSSYKSRDRSMRRSEDGRRSARSPDRKNERTRSSERKSDLMRSSDRNKSDRNRSQERKHERTRSPDRKTEKARSPLRKSDRSDGGRRYSNDGVRRKGESQLRSKRTRSFDKPRDSGKSQISKKSTNSNYAPEKSTNSKKITEDCNESGTKQIKIEAEDELVYSETVKMEEISDEDIEKDTEIKQEDWDQNLDKMRTNKNRADEKMTNAEIIAAEKKIWIRSAPADLYYVRDPQNAFIMKSTERGKQLQEMFRTKLIVPGEKGREEVPSRPPPKIRGHRHSHGDQEESSSDEEADPTFKTESQNWLDYRSKEPNRLHPELWQNLAKELNDGPACRCSRKARETGIRHGVWVGEEDIPKQLDPSHNNFYDLYHYRITISPPTNFLVSVPTMIRHDEHDFLFEGFSMFTRRPIPDFPVCKIIRFNIEYSILFFQETMPENFTINELNLFSQYFFYELLELWDWKLDERFIFMPRFARDLSEDGKELLSMNEVLNYLIKSYKPLVDKEDLEFIHEMKLEKWQIFQAKVRGMLVTKPGKAPSTIRIDHLDREHEDKTKLQWPEIVHFGLKPSQLCYAGNAEYQKQYRDFVKYRHLLANMPKPTAKDKQEYENMENRLMELRTNSKMKRDTTVVVSSKGFYRTGLMADIVQHAMLLPVLVSHLRFHFSLEHLENRIGYKFENRFLLQQALTHPSYKENFGTNPDHVRNTLSNCGIRQPEYGDKKVHAINSRKRGINTLINIMSKMGKKVVTESKVKHNERLEYLGDAVVEFITSAHLFFLFPDLEEGGLATYRSAIVLNQNLAELALALGLEKFILFSHGPDLCHDAELRHAMANCFEAFLGAIFLDGGINVADQVFNKSMFEADRELYNVWGVLPLHPLQTQEPDGDRHWIEKFPHLRELVKFENETGIQFKHIRVLARAFTDRSVGINNLTLGSNQRLEFLGDSVLQLVTSEFLYKHFPDHHEGHLSLLRASLVNNRTQAVVCDDLGMTRYAVYSNAKPEIKVKDKADLLEAFIGALYVDKDLFYCQVFAQVCFFPRLYQFILNQDWNDPKSKLQQCCLTLRTMDGRSPDIPIYKVIECKGPSNTREYTVAVYFRGQRLAKACGHSIQQAEFNAADTALRECAHLFPHLNYQKRVLMRSFKNQGIDYMKYKWQEETQKKRNSLGLNGAEKVKQEGSGKSKDKNAKKKSKSLKGKAHPKSSKERKGALERRSTEEVKEEGPQYDYYYDQLYWGSSNSDNRYRESVSRSSGHSWHQSSSRSERRESWQLDYREGEDRYKERYYEESTEEFARYSRNTSTEQISQKRTEDKDTRRKRIDDKKGKNEKRQDAREKRRDDPVQRGLDKDDLCQGKSADETTSVKKEAETELISEDDDNLENDMEEMVKDAVEISDDEIALCPEKGEKQIENVIDDINVKEEDMKKGETNDDVVMKELLNSTEDISADEDEIDLNTKCPIGKNETTKSFEAVEVKEESSDSAKVESPLGEHENTESALNTEHTDLNVSQDNQSEEEGTKETQDMEDGETGVSDQATKKMLPPPPESLPPQLPPLPEVSKSKEKKKERKKLDSSERVRKEIEEIENKLARKKAKAAKLAEKEKKRKGKEVQTDKIGKQKKESKSKADDTQREKQTCKQILKMKNNQPLSQDQEALKETDSSSGNEFDAKREDSTVTERSVANSQDMVICGEMSEKIQDFTSIDEHDPSEEQVEFTKRFKPIISTNESLEHPTVVKLEEVDKTEEKEKLSVEKTVAGIKKEENESDLEEGECSDDGEEDQPQPAIEPPSAQPQPIKEKVTSIKPFKIQDRKELQKQEKLEKTEKIETKELTDKEKEREEKKKRWRKESPKKSVHKDRDYREGKHRRGSHRSPSPRDRSSKYYEYERRSGHDRAGYYDYLSRSPSSHHSASYYDYYDRGSGSSSSRSCRSPRSGRRSTRSPSRSRYGGYESSRDSRDNRY